MLLSQKPVHRGLWIPLDEQIRWHDRRSDDSLPESERSQRTICGCYLPSLESWEPVICDLFTDRQDLLKNDI